MHNSGKHSHLRIMTHNFKHLHVKEILFLAQGFPNLQVSKKDESFFSLYHKINERGSMSVSAVRIREIWKTTSLKP